MSMEPGLNWFRPRRVRDPRIIGAAFFMLVASVPTFWVGIVFYIAFKGGFHP